MSPRRPRRAAVGPPGDALAAAAAPSPRGRGAAWAERLKLRPVAGWIALARS